MTDDPVTDVPLFWFEESTPKQWFSKDAAFDAMIRERFGDLHDRASRGELDHWSETPEGALALIIVLDQFSRNLYRDDARAFANDEKARAVLDKVLASGWDINMTNSQRAFLYLPMEHSEHIADQERSIALFAPLGEDNLNYALAHKKLIVRFGRFPHRNGVLGRQSTPEEEEYLAKPGAGF